MTSNFSYVMANDKIPSVVSLDRPENLKSLLKEDRNEDCLSCRLIGGGSFLGLAAYSYLSGSSQLEKQRAKLIASKTMFGIRTRKFGLAATSVGLAWLGMWRLFM